MTRTAMTPATQTITVTPDHVRRSFALWLEDNLIDSPLCKVCPLALAFKDTLGLPIEVGRNDLFLDNETITHDGLPEDLKRFEFAVNGILMSLGWPDGPKAKDPAEQEAAIAKLLDLLPFSFEFDATGLFPDTEGELVKTNADGESESLFRQELAHDEVVMQEQEALPPAFPLPSPSHFVSASCRGVLCRVCGLPATHKLGEEIAADDPSFEPQWKRAGLDGPTGNPLHDIAFGRHNLTAYVCCEHFALIVGPAAPCSLYGPKGVTNG